MAKVATPNPQIEWDSGTAYDFFASFWVLYRPEEFGIRASWAAGVRSRLSEESRRFMADALHFIGVPATWVHSLPEPRDSRVAIEELGRLGPAAIPEVLVSGSSEEEPATREVLSRVLRERSWTQEDVDRLVCGEMAKSPAVRKAEGERLARWLELLSRPEEFGAAFLRGMTEYRESFFREEERRIAPAVAAALGRAQERSRELAVPDLLEELTRGLRLGHLLSRPRLLLVPCYWCSPRIIYGCAGPDSRVILFGARPPEASVIPGDAVPASLSLSLAALADSTRLNILRLLRQEPLTQAEIARRLRLRPSTISHHLKSLRIAGLITYLDPEGSELRYAARAAGVRDVCASLESFLKL